MGGDSLKIRQPWKSQRICIEPWIRSDCYSNNFPKPTRSSFSPSESYGWFSRTHLLLGVKSPWASGPRLLTYILTQVLVRYRCRVCVCVCVCVCRVFWRFPLATRYSRQRHTHGYTLPRIRLAFSRSFRSSADTYIHAGAGSLGRAANRTRNLFLPALIFNGSRGGLCP